jgi:prevent-host-death family protein
MEAKRTFGKTINRVAFGKERLLLERHGQDVAAVVPLDDLRLLEELEERFDLEAARRALQEPGSVSFEALKKELGL